MKMIDLLDKDQKELCEAFIRFSPQLEKENVPGIHLQGMVTLLQLEFMYTKYVINGKEEITGVY